MNHIRIEKLIRAVILKLDLNLKSQIVLTEAATGSFFVTPIIAALSGARVYAIAKDSNYASADNTISFVKDIAKNYNCEKNITFIKEINRDILKEINIVTNLGHVRPLNRHFLENLDNDAVISLMCEPWEFRKTDIDLDFCKEKGIMIFGTNEDSPNLKIFDNTKMLIIKMLFDAGLEVYQNNILVISSDKFGERIYKTLEINGANVTIQPMNCVDVNSLNFDRLDAIIVADYTSNEIVLEKKSRILEKYPEVKIIQFSGCVDFEYLKNNIYPNYYVGKNRMAKTFGFLGYKPVIDLHATGLKVAEGMLKAKRLNLKNEDLNEFMKNYHAVKLN